MIVGMDEQTNPYKAPEPGANDSRDRPNTMVVPPTVAYAVIGFMTGTALAGSLVLSSSPLVKLEGGVMYGGTLGLLIGYFLGRRKTLIS